MLFSKNINKQKLTDEDIEHFNEMRQQNYAGGLMITFIIVVYVIILEFTIGDMIWWTRQLGVCDVWSNCEDVKCCYGWLVTHGYIRY